MTLSNRYEVTQRLKQEVRGKDLSDLALALKVTIYKEGQLNKGWVGQTLDRLAQVSAVLAQVRVGLDFELKSVCFEFKQGEWRPRETMAIT
jgi:DNA mismatch repair protein MutH